MVWNQALFSPATLSQGAASAARGVINAVLPPQCLACDALVATQGSLCSKCWIDAKFITAPQCCVCGVPYSFDPGADVVCGACNRAPPVFDRARAVFRYDELGRRLVVGFKHGDRTHGAPTFGRWLSRAGAELIADADVVAPVPLHRLRLMRRRFNQSALLAQAICRNPVGQDLQFVPDLLLRRRHTPSQAGLNAVQRRRNVRNAFAINQRRTGQIKGKRILLVDDVFTTGATVSECARILNQAGATGVDILTMARVDAPRGEL